MSQETIQTKVVENFGLSPEQHNEAIQLRSDVIQAH